MAGEMSLKEKAVLCSLAVAALYIAAGAVLFIRQLPAKTGAWAKARRAYEKAAQDYRKECALIARKAEWFERYDEEKSQMPMFGSEADTDTTWRRKLREIAQKNYVQVASESPGKEVQVGDVWERTFDIKNWEGGLESLVKFIYELETTPEGMFDVSSLNFKPNQKTGFLKGTLAVTCAYMKDDAAAEGRADKERK